MLFLFGTAFLVKGKTGVCVEYFYIICVAEAVPMASWVIHTMVAEKLRRKIPGLDIRGFVVGNIAPDCNVENEDWTQFTPPREVTHWMTGVSKATADYESFYRRYVKPGQTRELYAFYLGYYAHLITDAEFHMFLHDESRLRFCFERANSDADIREMIAGKPEAFETLKAALGRKRMDLEQRCLEAEWLRSNPGNLYEDMLCKVTEFPDYIDYLPEGAVTRKIPVMQRAYTDLIPPEVFVFYTAEELEKFVDDTVREAYMRLSRHGGFKMKAMKYLQEAVEEAASLAEMVDAFRNMCHMPVGADDEQLIFEAGVYALPEVPEYRRGDMDQFDTAAELVTAFMEIEENEPDIDSLLFPGGEPMFYFSLVRQFPDVEDEFFRIHMDVKFIPSPNVRGLSGYITGDIGDSGFFDKVLDSDIFKILSAEEMQDVQVYIDAT